jgi:hypothetical protein
MGWDESEDRWIACSCYIYDVDCFLLWQAISTFIITIVVRSHLDWLCAGYILSLLVRTLSKRPTSGIVSPRPLSPELFHFTPFPPAAHKAFGPSSFPSTLILFHPIHTLVSTAKAVDGTHRPSTGCFGFPPSPERRHRRRLSRFV